MVIKATICSSSSLTSVQGHARIFPPKKKSCCSSKITSISCKTSKKHLLDLLFYKLFLLLTPQKHDKLKNLKIANDKCLSRHLNFWRRIVYDCFIRNNGFFFGPPNVTRCAKEKILKSLNYLCSRHG